MKRHGKLLTLALAVLLALSMVLAASGLEIFIIASSDRYQKYATSAKYLEAIEVLKGYDDGELHLEEPILRYQAALFFGRVVTGITDESEWGEGPSTTFTDVPQYGNVIDMIAGLDIIRGYGNGKFGYNDGIRYQDMCAMWVRALGYETEDMAAAYPMSYVLKIEELGMDLDDVMPADYLNRGQVAKMLYDALTTRIRMVDDDKLDAIIQILLAEKGEENVNEMEDTYLERNFNVSSQMYFEIVATENYKTAMANGYAEEGYFDAYQLVLIEEEQSGAIYWDYDLDTVWSFPIDGEATAEVTEGDLILKDLSIVFDDKEPTPEKLLDEDMAIIHAEIAEADVYENLGELTYVTFDDENTDLETLKLGPTTVKFDGEYDPLILTYTDDAANAVESMSVEAFAAAIEANTYFQVRATDFDEDGEYDTLVYVPYAFGQYYARTYSGKTYHMVGQYQDSALYDVSNTAEKTDDNKTHFVERFLVSNEMASNSSSNYKPGDTSLIVSESKSKHSLNATLTGKEIKSGDFMLYNYNAITGELYVAETLGNYQVGTMTGIRTNAETLVIDGSAMSVGIAGSFADVQNGDPVDVNNGILDQETGFEKIVGLAKDIIANFEKGNANVKYLEYDAKLIYMEAYGSSDVVVGSDYVIVDMVETLEKHEDTLKNGETAWDIGFDGDAAVVETFDPVTGKFATVKVEAVTVRNGEDDVTTNFRYVDEKYALGSWDDMTAYNLFKANGVLYAVEDEDENGLVELYAYGTKEYKVLGAPILTENVGGVLTASPVFFSYNKSNEFIAENSVGILTDRVYSTAKSVSTVIGQDGYIAVEGELGTDTASRPNKLYLSPAAVVLAANDSQLTIFDPAGYTAVQGTIDDEVANVYGDNTLSIWHTGRNGGAEGVNFYIMLQNSMYNGSSAYEDETGAFVETEDGDKLYKHEYRNLYNLLTGTSETVTLVTTSLEAPATEVVNSIEGVIRYDADNYEATLTTFGEAYVDNGDYRYGGFAWLAAKDRISFTTQAKDEDGNGVITSEEKAQSCYYNSDSDRVYGTLDNLKVTFIDLDAGADVDSSEYSFQDAYVFYQETDSNRANYAEVTLIDREPLVDFAQGTFPVKRHYVSRTDVTDVIANGAVSNLSAGKLGLISSNGFFRWNGWSDYLIPAVDEDGETIWSYAGSLRVKVTYYAYIDYDEDANSCDAIVVRVGEIVGKVAETDVIPALPEIPGNSGSME